MSHWQRRDDVRHTADVQVDLEALPDDPEILRQMLREVWRLQRDQFWVPDLSGIDWDAVYARYAPLLERVSVDWRVLVGAMADAVAP